MLGMTQQQLAQNVGIKFQQIQKYESGMNRVSASRLYEIAVALDVPISYFFEGASGSSDPEDEEDLLANREALELVRAFYAIPEEQRRRLLDLARVRVPIAATAPSMSMRVSTSPRRSVAWPGPRASVSWMAIGRPEGRLAKASTSSPA